MSAWEVCGSLVVFEEVEAIFRKGALKGARWVSWGVKSLRGIREKRCISEVGCGELRILSYISSAGHLRGGKKLGDA